MANHCGFCDTRRPQPTEDYPHGTRMLIINDDWLEFCESCGDNPEYSLELTATGEMVTLRGVFEMTQQEDDDV